jgi:putative oxidoreductase
MERLRYLTRQTPTLNDAALLFLRAVVAVIFVRHGWADVVDTGMTDNVELFRGADIPLPEVSARYTGYLQLFGGALLVPGLLSRLISAGLVVVMAGALIWVHDGQQIPIGPDGSGSGFAMAMGAASLALVLTGPGRLSLDHVIATRAAGPVRTDAISPIGIAKESAA